MVSLIKRCLLPGLPAGSASYASISWLSHFQHMVSKVTMPVCILPVEGERTLEMVYLTLFLFYWLGLSQMATTGELGRNKVW